MGKNAYKIHKDPTVGEAEDIIGHLSMTSKPTILIPILKHYDHIKHLKEIFEMEDFKQAMAGETVLIIDDEADQASLNSYGRSNSKNVGDEENETSATYDAILKLRAIYRHAASQHPHQYAGHSFAKEPHFAYSRRGVYWWKEIFRNGCQP